MQISHPTIVFAVAAALYTFPSLVAVILGRRHQWGVFAINLATGWTVIGWMSALRWALAKNRPQRPRRARASRRVRAADAGLARTRAADHSAAIERMRMEQSWADAVAASDAYAQWLDEGAVRRETPPAAVATAAPLAGTPDAPWKTLPARRPRNLAPAAASTGEVPASKAA